MLWCCCLVQREPRGGGIAFSVSGRWDIERAPTNLGFVRLKLGDAVSTRKNAQRRKLPWSIIQTKDARRVEVQPAEPSSLAEWRRPRSPGFLTSREASPRRR